ncbi:MAG: hypothetical protein DHS80DRAFT_31378 [Piptocephalis tieghemiana]|nr:MAG: hypothetical protein DHS80DRAFT_31378 [Piptocephalis tieghemiana]
MSASSSAPSGTLTLLKELSNTLVQELRGPSGLDSMYENGIPNVQVPIPKELLSHIHTSNLPQGISRLLDHLLSLYALHMILGAGMALITLANLENERRQPFPRRPGERDPVDMMLDIPWPRLYISAQAMADVGTYSRSGTTSFGLETWSEPERAAFISHYSGIRMKAILNEKLARHNLKKTKDIIEAWLPHVIHPDCLNLPSIGMMMVCVRNHLEKQISKLGR